MSLKTMKIVDREVVYPVIYITGIDAVRQRLENRLKLQLGEWALEPEAGINWRDILNGVLDLERIKLVVKSELLQDEYVNEVREISINFNREKRKLKIIFTAVGSLGTVNGQTEAG